MKRVRRIFAFVLVLTLWVIAVIPDVVAQQARTTVKIGVAGPMTGSDRAFGELMTIGVNEAVADINSAGGIDGRAVEVVTMDDQSDQRLGEAVAKKMAEAGVTMVVGHISSDVTLKASQIYADNGIIMITPASTSVEITKKNLWNVFRTCGRDDQQGEVAGKYIAEKLAGKKVAIIHDGTLYGKGLADQTRSTMRSLGLTEALYGSVDRGAKDMSAVVGKLKISGVQIVYWGGLYNEGGQLLRQMRDAGVTAVMMSGDGITTDEFSAIAGSGSEGTLMTYHADPMKLPEAKEVTAKLIQKKSKLGAFTLYSYAAVQVFVAAAIDAKTLETRKIAGGMRSGKTWSTVIGPVAYDNKGDITRPDYVMFVWKKGLDGKITYVEE